MHSSLLDYYSQLGVKVKNIKRALSFRQAAFLKPWVEMNTRGRTEAQISGDYVKKAFHKLIGNKS